MQLPGERPDRKVVRWPHPRPEAVGAEVDELGIDALVALLESFAAERQRIHQAIEEAEARARACFDRHDAVGVQAQFEAIDRHRARLVELQGQEQTTQEKLDRRVKQILAEWQEKAEAARATWQAEQARLLGRVHALIQELESALDDLSALPVRVASERERLLRERSALLARGGRFIARYPPPALDLDPIDVAALGERLSALVQRT